MKLKLSAILGTIICILLSSCADITSKTPRPYIDKEHLAFTDRTDHPKTYDVYRNKELLSKPGVKASKLTVNLTSQRTQLWVASADGQRVAIDAPCTTGKRYKRTPTGNYTITEKIKNKRSSIFGKCYYGSKLVHRGDVRKCKRKYTRYVGAALPYWMRVNNNGIGFHSSNGIRRYPASNGCIRLPLSVAKEFYSLTNKHTAVSIVSTPLPPKSTTNDKVVEKILHKKDQ